MKNLPDILDALEPAEALAALVGDEIVTEGKDVDDYTVEAAICRQLGLPEPEAEGAKGILGKVFGFGS